MAPITVIIPARLASTRFPEKVLACLTGKPLVQHVAEAAARCTAAAKIVVATDHQRVVDALRPFGTTVILTDPDHPNGTSRLAEAATILQLGDDEIVVNAQGDEPEMAGSVIDAAVAALLQTPGAQVGTVAAPITSAAEFADRNIVKVVRGAGGQGLYFSRAPIPHDRDSQHLAPPLRHIGVYAYRVGFLRKYVNLAPTPLERTEQLEQLRVLETGHTIGVHLTATAQQGIDTPEQYAEFVRRFMASQS